jgi:protein CpxP
MRPTQTKTLVTGALALTALALMGTALGGPLGRHQDASERVDARLERMTERLDLSADQQARIRSILEEQHAAADLRRQETQRQIDAVLTDPQRAERDRMLEGRMDRRLDRLTDRLDLSSNQVREIRAILEERRSNPDLTRSEIKDRIAAVLTEDQRRAFEQMGPRRGRGERGRPFGPPPES